VQLLYRVWNDVAYNLGKTLYNVPSIDNARAVVLEDDKIIADRDVLASFYPLNKAEGDDVCHCAPKVEGSRGSPVAAIAATFLIASRGVCEVSAKAAFPLCRVGGPLIPDYGNMRTGQKIQMYNVIVHLAAHDNVNLTQLAPFP